MTINPLFRWGLAAVLATSASLSQALDSHDDTQADWNKASEIVQAVQPPQIPNRDYLITDFDAKRGDARPAIMAAIEQASADGGGRVIIPEGQWESHGPIHLKSRINLHISEGATLLFSPEPEDYLPAVLTRWEGTEMYGYSPLIYAYQVQDVAVTGKGTLDGNEDSEFHPWYDKQRPDMDALRAMGAAGNPVEERQFAEGHFLRPSMLQIVDAQRVLLEDYTIKNSPFWINHLVYTDHAIVRGLKVDSMFPNNDGIDVDSSRYVIVENNYFRTGDDSVVIKSGRDYDGRQVGRPSEYVVVRNNDMGGEDGIALGSEMSGGIRHVYFTDNILRSGKAAVRFKANLDRGGVAEHIRVRNMTIESFDQLFWFQLNYPGELGGNYPTVYRDLVFEDITVESTGSVLEVYAPEGYPLQDVTLRNITIKKADDLFVLDNVQNLVFDNVEINGNRVNGQLDWK
ncbi:glycoside hydrolase family 28 protein [Marinimicrobium sp. C6131]|uniref:glycoside hydrolase family 28 protein n=1 Tax=Marinimicrobium sp. C6131 TaxID=3022676 RepID=UPI00223CB7E1|nr:glycoside hydrolase family 28 protein [Marinimicrobium sp. C6131]UZJ42849.1 glycoside hydrolase family 28 protein [Marinimicrobium sp. C6131]